MSANIHAYIWRPLLHTPALCTLKELQDGTYTLNDLADMHEAMDEEAEYQRRFDALSQARK